jgi:hypothetical protein
LGSLRLVVVTLGLSGVGVVLLLAAFTRVIVLPTDRNFAFVSPWRLPFAFTQGAIGVMASAICHLGNVS